MELPISRVALQSIETMGLTAHIRLMPMIEAAESRARWSQSTAVGQWTQPGVEAVHLMHRFNCRADLCRPAASLLGVNSSQMKNTTGSQLVHPEPMLQQR